MNVIFLESPTILQLLLDGRVEKDFMVLLQLDEKPSMIVKNVKIDKIVFVENYTPKKWLHLMEECH
jgi:hypothetical protein